MTRRLESGTWCYRQDHHGKMLHVSAYVDANGTQYSFAIEGRGVGGKRFKLDRSGIANVGRAVDEIEQNPDCVMEFVLSPELLLRSEPPKIVLANGATHYEFDELKHPSHF
jgi:hypothetical protein